MDFPIPELSISNSKTEAIKQGTIQNIEKYLSIQTQFIGLLQSQQKIYDHQE